MTDFNLKKKQGSIVSYNLGSGFGVLKIPRIKKIRFHITSFKSYSSRRYPEPNDQVEVVFSEDGRLISVWLMN